MVYDRYFVYLMHGARRRPVDFTFCPSAGSALETPTPTVGLWAEAFLIPLASLDTHFLSRENALTIPQYKFS